LDPLENVTGWFLPVKDMGSYGTNYETRAVVATVLFGANQAKDACYAQA